MRAGARKVVSDSDNRVMSLIIGYRRSRTESEKRDNSVIRHPFPPGGAAQKREVGENARPFAPPTPQQIALPCSPASQLLWPRPTSHARASSATAPRLPDADRRTRERTLNRRPDVGYPSFRRDPFARDVLLDPGGTAMPRITALHMLRSTIRTVSAPANSSFRGSITHPTQPLCTFVFGVTAASRT